MKTPALLCTALNTVELGEIEIPAPAAGQALVEIELSTVSPGTELRVMRGEQEATPPYPFIPGYAAIGRVAQVGDGVSLKVGTRVLSPSTESAAATLFWGGHCAHHVRAASTLISIPDGVSDKDAAMVRLASIAHRGVRLARPALHESVIVIGLGPVGQCSARLFRASGARVLALDRVEQRVELLQQQGIDARVVTSDLVAMGRAVFPGGADIVVDASGAAPVALLAPQLLRDLPWNDLETPGARYVVQGSYQGKLALDYGDLFQRETRVLFPRDGKRGDLLAVLSLLERGALSLGDIIGQTVAPAEASRIYGELIAGKAELLTAAFDWRAAN